MSEYERLGDLETIPCEQIDVTPRRYLSHHGVMQNKLRVVFDGSCSSPSLNECLHTGAKLQRDISTVIVRWRLFKFAFAADIVTMYCQIKIHQDDVDWLRIVMRASPDFALTDKRLLTVKYGTSCAPFQALRTRLQLAEDTLAEACLMGDQFIDILRRAGMSLGKWAANEPSLLPESENLPTEHVLDPDNTVSTLSLKWSPISDVFSFTVQESQYMQPSPRESCYQRSLACTIYLVYWFPLQSEQNCSFRCSGFLATIGTVQSEHHCRQVGTSIASS